MAKTNKYIYVATILAGLMFPASLIYAAVTPKTVKPPVPRYVVDPFWPKSLPDGWVTGQVQGTCVDAKDHLFVVTAGFQNFSAVRDIQQKTRKILARFYLTMNKSFIRQ